MRLNKAIAQLGICSRRKADAYIAAGKVYVNGNIVQDMGRQVDIENDTITITGTQETPRETPNMVYIALHKPIDYICSLSDEQGPSVIDLITPENQLGKKATRASTIPRVYPVGRLDKDSEGLVLLTNDGELTNMLTHPTYAHEKEYEVTIESQLSKEAQKILQKGMHISEEEYVHGIQIKNILNKGKKTIITVVLKEGKNRQIRRMFGQLGYPVIQLKRTRINNLTLNTLPTGRWVFVPKSSIV